ncbi:MAG: MurR/RpiR family transcriptional regulator [Faecalibacillus sp.]
MIITEKLGKVHFSSSEKMIVDYITSLGLKIEKLSATQIAKETYTSAPLVVRVAKKLGYNGWNDFKEAYIKEMHYLLEETDVDASIPFIISDDMMTITNNIAILERDTIKDTQKLLDHDQLLNVFSILRNADTIDMYGILDNLFLAKHFQSQMTYINKNVNICDVIGNEKTMAYLANSHHCAIIISYSGQTQSLLDVARIYKDKEIPVIAITCIGENSLNKLSHASLYLSSKEMLNIKIGNFASSTSLKYLLDIIYAGIFSFHYKENLEQKIILASLADDRHSDNEYINEK